MIDVKYLDAIKGFEGFTPRAKWDYAQSSNGYGTKALHEGEVIDRAEADRRFKSEIKAAYEIVDKFAPNLDQGSKAALTSLTYNAGAAWTRSGLGTAIRAGDLETAKAIFQQYNKAGGEVLAGLQSRRNAELMWFDPAAPQTSVMVVSTPDATNAVEAPQDASKLSAIEAELVKEVAVNLAAASKTSIFTGRTTTDDSIIDRSSPQLRHDAALTLASILSILSMSHLGKDGAAPRDDENAVEKRAADLLKHADAAA